MRDINDYGLEFLRAMKDITKIVDMLEFEINNNEDENVVITYESNEVKETKVGEKKNKKNLLLQLDKTENN